MYVHTYNTCLIVFFFFFLMCQKKINNLYHDHQKTRSYDIVWVWRGLILYVMSKIIWLIVARSSQPSSPSLSFIPFHKNLSTLGLSSCWYSGVLCSAQDNSACLHFSQLGMAPFPAPTYIRKSWYIIENICKYMHANRNEPRVINNTKTPLCQWQNIKINFAYSFPPPSIVPIPPPLSQPHIMTEKKRRRRCMFRGLGRFPSPAPSSSLRGTKKMFHLWQDTYTRRYA